MSAGPWITTTDARFETVFGGDVLPRGSVVIDASKLDAGEVTALILDDESDLMLVDRPGLVPCCALCLAVNGHHVPGANETCESFASDGTVYPAGTPVCIQCEYVAAIFADAQRRNRRQLAREDAADAENDRRKGERR